MDQASATGTTTSAELSVALSERLLYVNSCEYEQAMLDALKSIGATMNISRCSLFLFHSEQQRVQLASQWCAPGIPGNPSELVNTKADRHYPWLLKRLLSGESVSITHLSELPDEAARDRAVLRAQSVRSLLMLPIFIGDQPLGAFGVDSTKANRLWSRKDQSLLESARNLLTHALLRFRAEEYAREAELKYHRLVKHSQTIFYMFDRAGRYTFISPSVKQMTGFSSEQVVGHHYSEFTHPDDIQRLAPLIKASLVENKPTPPIEYRIKARDGRVLWHRSVIAPIRDEQGRLESFVANALDVTDLHQESELRQLLLHLASRFINLPLNQFDQGVNAALARIGNFVSTDRVYVFRYDFDNGTARNTHEWCAPGIDAQIKQLQAVPLDQMNGWLAAHRAHEHVLIDDVDAHPEKTVRELLQSQGIRSALAVPLMHGKACIGFVGLDSVRSRRVYSETEIRLLGVFAEILVNLHERRSAQRAIGDAARRLGQIIDGTHAGTWEWNQLSRQLVFNQRWAEMLGFPSAEDLPDDSLEWTKQVHPDDLASALESFKQHLRGETDHHQSEIRVRHADGHWMWMLLRGQVATRAADGRAEMVSGIALDITERKLAEDRLRLAASVFSHTHEGILITDKHGSIIDVNNAFTVITGYERSEAIGRNPRFLQSGRQDDDFYAAMWASLERDGYWSGEVWNRRKSGEFYAENLTISAIHDSESRVLRYVGLFSDITHHKVYQQHLEKVAHFDALTGLPNRTLLADRLSQALVRSGRSNYEVVVAYIDVDDFKSVNDQFGHTIGDECLRQLGARLIKTVRASDTVARLGGDEFVLVLADIANRDTALELLERLLAIVARPCRVNGREITLTVSIGATLFPQEQTQEADQLLRQADQAMYEAKSQGRNRIHFFDAEMERIHADRLALISQLRSALGDNQLRLHYQPKVNLVTGRLEGLEALIRWQHPERGLLMPDKFLPALEGDELAHAVGHWVIDQALADLAGWRASGLDLELSVNVSAQQLLRAGFADALARRLKRYPDIAKGRLTLEFLETGILEDINVGRQVTRDCHALGVNFALDDFGTGFSSLSHLKHLSLRQIKIDRSFIIGMLEDPEDLAIIEGVINLGRAFDLEVLAEGVESIEQAATLVRLGCQRIQGYLVARPMPAEKIEQWVSGWHGLPMLDSIEPTSPDLTPLLFARAEIAARLQNMQGEDHADSASRREIRSPSRFSSWLEQATEKGEPIEAIELQTIYRKLIACQQNWKQAAAEGKDSQREALAERAIQLAQNLSGRLDRLLDQGSSIG